jgi:hypothetical protein
MKNLTYESIERRNRIRRNLFRSMLLALLVAACIAIGWFITTLGYEPLYESGVHHTPALQGAPATPHALALCPRT